MLLIVSRGAEGVEKMISHDRDPIMMNRHHDMFLLFVC